MEPQDHECKFIIVKTNNWIFPKDDEPCWGLECEICEKLIYTGFTKKELNKILKP